MQLIGVSFMTDASGVEHVTATVSYSTTNAFGTRTEQNSFELTPTEVAKIMLDRSDASIKATVSAHLTAINIVELLV